MDTTEERPVFSRSVNSAEGNSVQDNSDVPIDDKVARDKRLDELREQARKAAEIFDKAGRPMGGAKDD